MHDSSLHRALVSDHNRPRIVVMPQDFPGLPGIAFTQKIRTGFSFVPRETSIILMMSAPTRALLESARRAGVDEVVAFPFTTTALLTRIRSVIDRPRPFVDCAAYVGPCRRRLMVQDYKGPLRRSEDPEAPAISAEWQTESNRSAARRCVQKMAEYRNLLPAADCERLREVYRSVMSPETRERQETDEQLGEAARLIGCQLSALPPGDKPAASLLTRQVDLLHQLVFAAASLPSDVRAQIVGAVRLEGTTAAGVCEPP